MSDFVRETLELTRRYAQAAFSNHSNSIELINDAVSVAWEMARQPAENANPTSIGTLAVRRIKVSRQFRWSKRTVDHPINRETHQRLPLAAGSVSRVGDNPADIAQANIDVAAWFKSLSATQREFARLFAAGLETREIAKLKGVSPGRVSQRRAELRENWAEFILGDE